MTVTRKEVIDQARKYLGVKFKLHGRDARGMDCVGLLYRVGIDLGFKLEDDREYNFEPQVKKINRVLDAYTMPAPTTTPRHGQVVKLRQNRFPMHLGFISVEGPRITVLNANFKKGGVCEDPWLEWEPLVMEYREVVGVG